VARDPAFFRLRPLIAGGRAVARRARTFHDWRRFEHLMLRVQENIESI
jgi:hypothetical protein